MKKKRRSGRNEIVNPVPPSGAHASSTRQIPVLRKWLFRLCLVILSPIIFCVLLEAGLRLGGYGYPTGFFLQPDARGSCDTNYRFGWRFFPRALAKGPDPYILRAKPAGAVRIFVLGSSAAMGIPDASFSFGRILEVMLRQQYPEVQFEVVNAAVTAINSHVALEIASDCAAHKPDLFVIYMGNNEMIGPYGPGTIFQKWSPNLRMIRASIWAKSTRVGQLLSNIASAVHRDKDTPGHWRGMEMFLNNPVAADDPRLPAVYENYRRNLTAICGIARDAGAGVVLSSVAVNLRDCPPFASQHRADLKGDDLAKWESIYKAADSLASSNHWQEAVEQYEAAAKIDDRFADLQFRLGLNLIKTGRAAEARSRLELARDLDVLRFRADSHINPIISEVAAARKADSVRFIDAEKMLSESNPDSRGIPGDDLFYEHVHFTFDGDYLLAKAVFNDVCASLPQLAGLNNHGGMPSKQRCAELLALTQWEEYRLADAMLDMTARPPFTNQFDHKLRQATARQLRDDLYKTASTPEALRKALKMYQAALAKEPEDGSLHRLIGRWAMKCGLPKIALAHLEVAARTRPGDVWVQCDYGNALANMGRVEEAISEYKKALKIKPDLEIAYNNLGLAMVSQRKLDAAIAHYQKALTIKPDFETAHNNLGLVLAGEGRLNEAITHYRKAVETKPDYADAHFNLALAQAQTGNLPEAVIEFQKTLETKPDDAEAHFKLALALTQTGDLPEAITHFRKTLEITPESLDAHFNLATILAQTGNLPEAIEHYQQAVRIKPNGADAHYNLAVALRQTGRLPEAILHFREALRIKPGTATTHYNLALALAQTGKMPEAIGNYTEAVRLKPDFLLALNNLAWIRATSEDANQRNGSEAVRLAEQACQLTGRKQFGPLDTLAAAYAESGRYTEAVTAAEEAIALAKTAKQQEPAAEIQGRLDQYHAGKPYRETVQTTLLNGK